jgi:type I restriction enzyme S subunit
MKTIPWLGEYAESSIAVKHAYALVLGKMEQPLPTDGDVEVEYLNSGCLQWDGVEPNPEKKMWASPTEIRNLCIRSGDLLIAEGGDVGRAAIYHGDPGRIFQKSLHRARGHEGSDVRYLRYVLIALHESGWLDILCNKATMAHFTAEKLGSLEIPYAPIEEQRRIADFLDAETARIDQLTTLQTTVLDKLDQRDRVVRDCLIDDLIDQVGELPLRRFVSKIEQGTSPQCENHPRESDRWGVLKLSAVKGGRFYPEANKQLPDDIEPAREYEVHEGDLLVSRANTPELVGDVAVAEGVDPKLLLPDLIYRVGLDRRIRADFAVQVLLSTRIRRLIQATARGSSQSMVKLRGEDIREWPIPRANARQQQELVSAVRDHLASSDRLRSSVHRQLVLLAERRRALITAAVTGGIAV